MDVTIRIWHRLPLDARAAIVDTWYGSEQLDLWRNSVERTATDSDATARLCAAQIAGDFGDRRFARMLTRLLTDPDRAASDAAGASLVHLARAPRTDVARSPADRRAAESEFESALAVAARAYPEHRCTAVFAACAVLLDSARLHSNPGPLARWFADSDHESLIGFRTFVRRSTDPLLRARAWTWLGIEGVSVGAAALERVARAESIEDHESVLCRAHLAANPARARRVAIIPAPSGRGKPRHPRGASVPDPKIATRLSTAARRGLIRFVSALRPSEALRASMLEPFLTDPDAVVRHAAMRGAPHDQSLDYCFDADARVARTALISRWLTGGDPAELWSKRARSPHASVRMLAVEECAASDPWEVWSERSRLAARRILHAHREGFIARLRARINEGDARRRVDGILLARRLRLSSHIEFELLRAIQTPSGSGALGADDPVAAAAAAALADVPTESARAALLASLAHRVQRVRANALEGAARAARRQAGPEADFAATHPRLYSSMLELKVDSNHRVRANAIRALLGPVPTDRFELVAVESLGAMLRDERPLHRLAGLWVAERLLVQGGAPAWQRCNDLAGTVARLARDEPETAVRARAERCAHRVLSGIRSEWSARAGQGAAIA